MLKDPQSAVTVSSGIIFAPLPEVLSITNIPYICKHFAMIIPVESNPYDLKSVSSYFESIWKRVPSGIPLDNLPSDLVAG